MNSLILNNSFLSLQRVVAFDSSLESSETWSGLFVVRLPVCLSAWLLAQCTRSISDRGRSGTKIHTKIHLNRELCRAYVSKRRKFLVPASFILHWQTSHSKLLLQQYITLLLRSLPLVNNVKEAELRKKGAHGTVEPNR